MAQFGMRYGNADFSGSRFARRRHRMHLRSLWRKLPMFFVEFGRAISVTPTTVPISSSRRHAIGDSLMVAMICLPVRVFTAKSKNAGLGFHWTTDVFMHRPPVLVGVDACALADQLNVQMAPLDAYAR